MSRTILINNTPVELELTATNLTDLIKEVYGSGLLKDEVVKSVKFEGTNLLLADQAADQSLPNGTLEIESVPAWSIILELLSDAEGLQNSLRGELTSAVEAIRAHSPSEAMDPLERSADILLVLVELFSSIDKFLRCQTPSGVNIGFLGFKTRSTEILRDILQLQADRDWVSLADLIEDELIPALDELHNQLKGYTAEIRSASHR